MTLTHADVRLAKAEAVLVVRSRQRERLVRLAGKGAASQEELDRALIDWYDAREARDLALLDAGKQPEAWS